MKSCRAGDVLKPIRKYEGKFPKFLIAAFLIFLSSENYLVAYTILRARTMMWKTLVAFETDQIYGTSSLEFSKRSNGLEQRWLTGGINPSTQVERTMQWRG